MNVTPAQLEATKTENVSPLAHVLGCIPHRLQLAGGWIDQPFMSQRNPSPPGSMVVAQIQPDFRPMERSGFATGTRAIAIFGVWFTS